MSGASLGGFKLPASAEVVQPSDTVVSSGSASSSADNTQYWPTLEETLKGYLTSAGAQNAKDREYNESSAKAQRDWATEENEKARQWQEYMSGTNYQRTVEDLRKAGLNPILAVNGLSANTPGTISTSGSSASHQSSGSDTLSSLLNAFANVASSVADFLPNVVKSFVTRLK